MIRKCGLPGLLCIVLLFPILLHAQSSVSVRAGIVRFTPFRFNSPMAMPSQFGIRTGIGFGGTENDPFIGVIGIAWIPVTDTFSAEGRTGTFTNPVPATGHRTTKGFGLHFPVNLRIYSGGFFTAYGGLAIGFIVGSSEYSYTDENGHPIDPTEDYPEEGKSKIRALPGAINFGGMYEFEKFSPYAELGITYGGLREVPGLGEGWMTVEAGILWHL